MNLRELYNLFISSNKDDWNYIVCSVNGKVLTHRFYYCVQSDSEIDGSINVKYHPHASSYKEDLSITIAWGLEPDFPKDLSWAVTIR